ncbi:DNA cytosine methyltransferase [Spirabiliibacterium mucosae]|uniref:DNA cytosine methyltransferase n=1 Tax=Spirabiliibacterium mucosae TaxID=28156 RepID=UPI001AAD2391
MLNHKRYFLDLFSGAGGLSEGFIQAGFNPIAHIESDKAACFTLRTRSAYHWLKSNQKEDVYENYLTGKISRDEFYACIPDEIMNSVINETISEESLDNIFLAIDHLLKDKLLT